MTHAAEDAKKEKYSLITWSANQYSVYGKECGGSSRNLKYIYLRFQLYYSRAYIQNTLHLTAKTLA